MKTIGVNMVFNERSNFKIKVLENNEEKIFNLRNLLQTVQKAAVFEYGTHDPVFIYQEDRIIYKTGDIVSVTNTNNNTVGEFQSLSEMLECCMYIRDITCAKIHDGSLVIDIAPSWLRDINLKKENTINWINGF